MVPVNGNNSQNKGNSQALEEAQQMSACKNLKSKSNCSRS